MQKKLIALAVAGLVSGGAFAQSNVTVYGIIDAGYVHDSGNAAGSASRLSSGVNNGSRLGFKGTEDLGNGLKTNFTAETGFCADSNAGAPAFCTGGNNFMGRQAWVNLSGNFGTVQAGRQYVPGFTMVLAPMDPFGAGTAGQMENLTTAGVGYGNPRANNVVTYVTPTVSGFTGVAAYVFGETTGSTSKSSGYTLAGGYGNGPLALGASYLSLNDTAGNSGGANKNTNFGATYDLGMVKLRGIFQTVKMAPLGVVATDASDWMLGLTAPMGGGVGSYLAASYVNHNDKRAANQDASQVGVGYYYGLSKRTTVYTVYAKMNRKNGNLMTVGNATDAGTGDSAFNLGVTHAF